MRKDYCARTETVTECPICGKLLLEGPEMTRKEKAIQRLKGKPNYRNIFKHILNHRDQTEKKFNSPERWKKWDQEKQVKWIMTEAKEYLDDLESDA